MRTARFRRAARTSALGAVALIASLSLTACQGDDEAASVSPSATAGSSSQSPAENSGASGDKGTAAPDTDQGKDSAGSGSGSGSGSGKGSGSGSGSGSSSGSGSGDKASKPEPAGDGQAATATCTGKNTKLSITAVERPVNHLLLTMTNTGSKACNAYYYPYLKFGAAQAVPQTFEDSKPQAVATINPGESVYTGVMTSAADGSGSGGYSTKNLSVSFQNRDGNSDGTGPAVSVPLGKSVFVDSSLSVTYWQMSMNDALTY
ncbi:DUF4232 domain-containing protein [Streptomyces sp. NBC_00338]|uniref:DUF4232 domain-containing protein n=1 Tax=Streptomyces sp. NBC_00338 TaxID=2975715 RepID=UPI00225B1C90|nr:DUF4232 domain-containing protein [Streptomyces sp. NBC_00338]MCX5141017.1 DUF4232 domain-containing protein [Streptomyces sp. NBC_00338]